MDYFDQPQDGYRSELAPPGLYLGYAGAIAAFLLPAMGAVSEANQSLNYIQAGFET